MACAGAREARVNFRYDQTWDNIVSRNPPVEFRFEDVCPKGYTITATYAYSGYRSGSHTRNIGYCNGGQIFNPTGSPYQTSSKTASGQIFIFWVINTDRGTSQLSDKFNSDLYVLSPQISLSLHECPNQTSCPDPDCRFIVSDLSGEIFSRKERTCPEVQITCNDCPLGQSRMGNCCVNCEDLAQQIRELQAIVRRL
jgi:hypothetical protein